MAKQKVETPPLSAEALEERRALEAQRIAKFRARRMALESYKEYALRHGNDSLNVGGMLLFEDGAKCDVLGMIRHEPPMDRIERLKARRLWIAEKYARARKQFVDLQQSVFDQDALARRFPNSVPSVRSDAPRLLRKLKQVVHGLAARLQEIDAQLGPSPEALQAQQEMQDRHHAQQVSLLNEVKSIRL